MDELSFTHRRTNFPCFAADRPDDEEFTRAHLELSHDKLARQPHHTLTALIILGLTLAFGALNAFSIRRFLTFRRDLAAHIDPVMIAETVNAQMKPEAAAQALVTVLCLMSGSTWTTVFNVILAGYRAYLHFLKRRLSLSTAEIGGVKGHGSSISGLAKLCAPIAVYSWSLLVFLPALLGW